MKTGRYKMKPVKRKRISIRQKAVDAVISTQNNTEEFLKLAGTWEDDRTADEIIADIKNSRVDSTRKIEDFDS